MAHTITINEYIRYWTDYEPFVGFAHELNISFSKSISARQVFPKERIAIKDRWFDVLTLSELVRKRNSTDGYYRAIYIHINWSSGEYYIGKVNRRKWSELRRYQGSGLKFLNKFKNNRGQFKLYHIAACATAEETEQLEASLVDNDLLADEKCLNLIAGGGGTNKRPSIAETREKKREFMRNHPEHFKLMLEASKIAFRSGDTPALRARNQRIKETMSADKYRKMTTTRIEKWRANYPSEYAEAKRKSHEAISTRECQEKRNASLKKWATENPEKHAVWQEKLLRSRTSEKAKEKRKVSLKDWKDKNPEQAKANAHKRAKAAAAKLSKEVCMIDLNSGEILRRFQSQHEAAKWLVENGKAKNMNCVSSISSVCLQKPCTTGYGYRKKAYGYAWRFSGSFDSQQSFPILD